MIFTNLFNLLKPTYYIVFLPAAAVAISIVDLRLQQWLFLPHCHAHTNACLFTFVTQ